VRVLEAARRQSLRGPTLFPVRKEHEVTAGNSLAREIVSEMVRALRDDPSLADEVATVLAPHIHGGGDGWLAAPDAVDYLGLGSLDALDRLVRDGLPYAQPHGPGGRRYFNRAALDAWMAGAS
jgi:hypothetical protein